MLVTEIQISLTSEEVRNRDGILAFARITFDNQFRVRDLKIMERDGHVSLGMPSRKLLDPCPSCRHRVDLWSNFCSNCGVSFDENQVRAARSFLDICHPTENSFRRYLETEVAKAYNDRMDPRFHLKIHSDDSENPNK